MPKSRAVNVGGVRFDNGGPLSFIAGLCAFESESMLRRVARALRRVFDAEGAPFVLKCSFDKANRTSLNSYRGAGVLRGLKAIRKIGKEIGAPTLTDVHEPSQAAVAARYVDMLQVPAFLCRQTDLLLACGRTGLPVNIKKGQFLAPWDMAHAVGKVESTGNRNILLTERGTSFGYGNLVVDMRALEVMRGLGYPVVYDATHSVQLPGALGRATGGERRFAEPLARAAAAVGVAGIFLETHPDPDRARSDGPNSVTLGRVAEMVRRARAVDRVVKERPS